MICFECKEKKELEEKDTVFFTRRTQKFICGKCVGEMSSEEYKGRIEGVYSLGRYKELKKRLDSERNIGQPDKSIQNTQKKVVQHRSSKITKFGYEVKYGLCCTMSIYEGENPIRIPLANAYKITLGGENSQEPLIDTGVKQDTVTFVGKTFSFPDVSPSSNRRVMKISISQEALQRMSRHVDYIQNKNILLSIEVV